MADLRFANPADFLAKTGTIQKVGAPTSEKLELGGPAGKTPLIKTVDFFMGGYDTTGDGSYLPNGQRNWNSWRNIHEGEIDFSRDPVNSNVLLIPSNMTVSVEGGMDLEDVKESFGKAGSILDVLSSVNEILTNTKAIGEWAGRTFKDVQSLKIGPSEYEFEFKFGNAGLNNSFEEVVKPIVALTMFFGVSAGTDYKDHLKNSAGAINVPYPTKAEYFVSFVKGAISSAADTANILTSGEASATQTLSQANFAIQSALCAGAKNVALSNQYRNLYLTWGRMTFGPLTYSGYKYSFDMSNLDEWGWPTSGKFTLSNLQSPRKATTQAMLSPFFRGV